jgi:hypothetical protein
LNTKEEMKKKKTEREAQSLGKKSLTADLEMGRELRGFVPLVLSPRCHVH